MNLDPDDPRVLHLEPVYAVHRQVVRIDGVLWIRRSWGRSPDGTTRVIDWKVVKKELDVAVTAGLWEAERGEYMCPNPEYEEFTTLYDRYELELQSGVHPSVVVGVL